MIDAREHCGGRESAQHTAPDRQAAFPNIQSADWIGGEFIRPMIDHVEEPRADHAGNNNPQNTIRELVGIEAFSSSFFKCQLDANKHGGCYDQAVPSEMEMTY